MTTYSLAHLSDGTLLRDLRALVARDRATTAQLLAHLAEVDDRRLYLPDGFPSMYAYCVGELRLSEDAAYKRIQAARAARQFPALFIAVAEGRLSLTGVGLLAPHLTPENAGELLGASAGRSKSEIEEMLARRFPRSELLPMVETFSLARRPDCQLAPAQVGESSSGHIETPTEQLSPGTVEPPATAQTQASGPRAKVAPVASERYALQLTIGRSTRDKLRHAQVLLGQRVSHGDLAGVLDRVLDLAIAQLEKQKFGAGRKNHSPRTALNPRRIPRHVKAAVWKRDGGRCTFESKSGRRCVARDRLEFDHVVPVARGGLATTENLRLRCRAHNQYEAERIFGADFVRRKRDQSREAAAREKANEVIPWLRALQVPPTLARQAAEHCMAVAADSIEERVRLALSYLGSRIARPRGFAKEPAISHIGARELALSSTSPSTSCSSAPP